MNLAKPLQYVAPIVLGIISEKNKIKMVRITEVIASIFSDGYKLVTSAPTPAAPIVWAIVFKVRIADNGLSIFSLKNKNDFAQENWFLIEARYDFGRVNNTASTKEQIKEMNNAKKR